MPVPEKRGYEKKHLLAAAFDFSRMGLIRMRRIYESDCQRQKFLQKVLAIAIPIALQNMVTPAVGMLDTIMLGQLGEVAMSASSLANQVGFIFQMINFGLTGGAGILTSQYWGRGIPIPSAGS